MRHGYPLRNSDWPLSSPVSATVAVPRLRVCPAITGRRLLRLRYYHEKQLSPERLFEVRDVTLTCATPLPPTHRESAPALDATSSAGAWMHMRRHEPAPPAHFSRIDRSGASKHASTAPPSFPGRGCRRPPRMPPPPPPLRSPRPRRWTGPACCDTSIDCLFRYHGRASRDALRAWSAVDWPRGPACAAPPRRRGPPAQPRHIPAGPGRFVQAKPLPHRGPGAVTLTRCT
jgi:hypothetical protein